MPNLSLDDIGRLRAQIIRGEGLRLSAYLDSKKILTIGYGHNCQARPVKGVAKVGDSISQAQAERLLDEDLARAIWDVRRNLPWAEGMNAPRQAVLVDMAFNLGLPGLLGFKRALAAAMRGDWPEAKSEMLRSDWAGQVGVRAIRLAEQMEKGEWV